MSIRTPRRRSVRLRLTLLYGALFPCVPARHFSRSPTCSSTTPPATSLVARRSRRIDRASSSVSPLESRHTRSGGGAHAFATQMLNGSASPARHRSPPKQMDAQFPCACAPAGDPPSTINRCTNSSCNRESRSRPWRSSRSCSAGSSPDASCVRCAPSRPAARRSVSGQPARATRASRVRNDELKELGDTLSTRCSSASTSRSGSQRQFRGQRVTRAAPRRSPGNRALSQVALGDPDATVDTLPDRATNVCSSRARSRSVSIDRRCTRR